MTTINARLSRRSLLRVGSGLGLATVAGGLLAACSTGPGGSSPAANPTAAGAPAPAGPTQAAPAQAAQISLRLGWLKNSQYAGDLVALDKGYFKQRGLDLQIDAGGPNIDPVSLTASGSNTIGNVSSIAAMFLARSQGVPVKAFATALQRHPFAFITTKDKNIHQPQDFVGKKIGIQATARPLLDAVIAKYNLPRDQIQVQVIGSDTTPLKTGQVDVITGWVIDAPQMAAVGADAVPLLLWDMGIHLYAFTYFTTEDVLKSKADALTSFLGASAQGWAYAAQHPDEATDITLKYGQDLKRDLELQTWTLEAPFMWSDLTREQGWGWMDAQVWDDAIKTYGDLGQLKNPITSADAMTQDILSRVGDRPKQ